MVDVGSVYCSHGPFGKEFGIEAYSGTYCQAIDGSIGVKLTGFWNSTRPTLTPNHQCLTVGNDTENGKLLLGLHCQQRSTEVPYVGFFSPHDTRNPSVILLCNINLNPHISLAAQHSPTGIGHMLAFPEASKTLQTQDGV